MKERTIEFSSSANEALAHQFYLLAEHWLSDIRFYLDELRFLKLLTGKYSMWLVEESNIEATRIIIQELHAFENQCKNLESAIQKHLVHLRELEQSAFAHDPNRIRDDHADFETEVAEFTKLLRGVKHRVFQLTEKVIDTEDINPFLERN